MITASSSYDLSIPVIDIPYLVDKYPEKLRLNCKRRRGTDRTYYDFSTATSQYDVTEATIEEYFDVEEYNLSRKNLCPRISNRMEYIRILEYSLMESLEIYYEYSNNEEIADEGNKENTTDRWIVDIGTGSSLIYPIIGSKMCLKNRFIATEIDQESIEYAKQHILPNLKNVQLVEVKDPNVILPVDRILQVLPHGQKVRYTLCNPPFYTDENELDILEAQKITAKQEELVLAQTEMYYKGGEVEFIKLLIDQSIELNKLSHFKNCWYSSQVGIHSHIKELIDYCRLKGITNTFQGCIKFTTSRWIVAWNFSTNFLPISHIPSTKPIDSTPIHQKLQQLKESFDEFDFKIISTTSNNLYLICNEVIWLRKIKRQAQRGDVSTLFQKLIVLRFNMHGIELAYNDSNIDKVTVTNSAVAQFQPQSHVIPS